MLKRYEYRGRFYQWEEGQQPNGAVEVKKAEKPNKKAPARKNKKG